MLNVDVFSMFFIAFPGAEGLSCGTKAHMAVLWAQAEAQRVYAEVHEAYVEPH